MLCTQQSKTRKSAEHRSCLCCIGYILTILQVSACLGLLLPLVDPEINREAKLSSALAAGFCLCFSSLAPAVLRPSLRDFLPFYTTIIWVVWSILFSSYLLAIKIDVYPTFISHLTKLSLILLFSVISMHLYNILLRAIKVEPQEDPVFTNLHNIMFGHCLPGKRAEILLFSDVVEEEDYEGAEELNIRVIDVLHGEKHKFSPTLETISEIDIV